MAHSSNTWSSRDAHPPERAQGPARPRGQLQRHHQRRSHQLLRNHGRPPTSLEFGIRIEADRLFNSYVKREDLVSEMTVVRNEFERGENTRRAFLASAFTPPLTSGTTTANRPSQPLRHRARPDRKPASLLQEVLPTRQRGAHRRPASSKRRRPWPSSRNTSARCRGQSGSWTTPTRKSRPRTASARVIPGARVGTVGSVGVPSHMPPPLIRTGRRLDLLGASFRSSRRATHQALVDSKSGYQRTCVCREQPRPRPVHGFRQAEPGQLDTVRDTLCRPLENLASVRVQA